MTSLEEILLEEIRERGWIPFERYMEAALYHPALGYYERAREVGRFGDFYTSVSVGSLFAELLARDFVHWEATCQPEGELTWVECGAHQGQFALDFCSALRSTSPPLWNRMTYRIIEPSPSRASSQRECLAEFGDSCQWLASLDDLPPRCVTGAIFSNELLDAMPVTRVGWDASARRWFEWGVAWKDGAFAWERARIGDSGAQEIHNALARICGDEDPALHSRLLDALPDQFTLDVSPSAIRWWERAASKLFRGRLMTFDYGLSTQELFSPARSEGTLRTYRAHCSGASALRDPGEQDLTAHVDWDALENSGLIHGLTTIFKMSQGQYLTRLASGLDRWEFSRVRQFQTLTHPSHLGMSHSVLVQAAPTPSQHP